MLGVKFLPDTKTKEDKTSQRKTKFPCVNHNLPLFGFSSGRTDNSRNILSENYLADQLRILGRVWSVETGCNKVRIRWLDIKNTFNYHHHQPSKRTIGVRARNPPPTTTNSIICQIKGLFLEPSFSLKLCYVLTAFIPLCTNVLKFYLLHVSCDPKFFFPWICNV